MVIGQLSRFSVLDFDLDGETTAHFKAHMSTGGIPVIAPAKMEEIRAKGAVCKGRVP